MRRSCTHASRCSDQSASVPELSRHSIARAKAQRRKGTTHATHSTRAGREEQGSHRLDSEAVLGVRACPRGERASTCSCSPSPDASARLKPRVAMRYA
eukprot:1009789-Rhodomonas_salina.5